jgi:Mg2+/citrate symporter
MMLLLLRELAVLSALCASSVYLWLYWRNPYRDGTLVSNMLIHLGTMQVIVYGGSAARLLLFPRIDVPYIVEDLTLLLVNVAAMSLTWWVLFAYIITVRSAKREEELRSKVSEDQ